MADLSMAYGVTGSRKTSAMGQAAEYLYEKTGGRITRAIYSDGGGWKPIKDRVDAGFIEPYNIQGEPDMPELLRKLSTGYWPERLENGLRPKGVYLKPPTADTWKKVGAYIWEGATTSAELLMKFLRDNQVSIGGDPVGKFTVAGSDFLEKVVGEKPGLFCSNNMKHYDFAQTSIIERFGDLVSLPVDRVLVTAHEASGTDEETREPLRGPGLVGKAGTPKIGRNVGEMIHFEKYVTPGARDGILKTEVRCYYESHPDPKFPNISYDCKSRVPKDLLPQLYKRFPGGFFDPSDFGEYLKFTDEILAQGTDVTAARKASIDSRLGIGKLVVAK